MENFTMTTSSAIQWIDARLGMPICGQAFRVRTAATATSVATTPGTHAWSPPIS